MKLYTYTAERSLPRIAVYGLPGDLYGRGFPFWPNVEEATMLAMENSDIEGDKMVILEVDSKRTKNIYGVPGEEAWAIHTMIEDEEGEAKAEEFIRMLETARTTEDWFNVVDAVQNMADVKPKYITVLGIPPEGWDWGDEVHFETEPKPVKEWKRPLVTRLLRSIFLPEHKLYGLGAHMGTPKPSWVDPSIIHNVRLVWASGKTFERGLKGAFGKSIGARFVEFIQEKVGKRVGKFMGRGKKGAVYRLEDGKVLKITMDAMEMRASARINGVIHPNLARVWDAFIVENGSKGVGVVVRDAVDVTLDSFDREAANLLDDILNYQVGEAYEISDIREAYIQGMKNATEALREEGCRTESDILLDIADAYRELGHLGIWGLDFGGQNFGMIESPTPRVALFDYGLAFVEGVQEVPVFTLESDKKR